MNKWKSVLQALLTRIRLTKEYVILDLPTVFQFTLNKFGKALNIISME